MSSIRSKPALIAGSLMLAVFFLITKGYAWALRPGAGETLRTLFRFFHPPSSTEPARWLAMEGVVLLIGFAGATLVGVGFFGRWLEKTGKIRSALRAGGWRPVLWAILIGYHGWSVVSLLSAFDHGYGRSSGLSQVTFLLWLVAPLGSTWCAARLLFGRGAWRLDPWIGYVTAAAAAFGIAWNGILLAGLGDAVPLIGAFTGGKLASGVTQLSAFALGCAAVWTGLVLARQRAAAKLGLRTLAPSVPLLTGGAVLGVALTKLHVLDFMTRSLSAGQTATYIALLALFAVAMLLSLANAAAQIARPAEAAGAAEMPPRAGLLRRAATALVGGRFWRDFFLSLVITMVLIGIAYVTVGQTPLLAAAFIMPLIIFGFLIGPIIMFVIGVLRGRPGFAAAPVIMVLAVFAYRYASIEVGSIRAKASVDEAASFNVYPFAEPSRKHDMVVIEGAYDSRPDGNCQAVCQQILFKSRYAVAYAEQESAQWRVYRLATGAEFCRQPAQVESYLQMTASRQLDTCLSVTREAPHQDALVIREDYALDLPIKKQLPKGVRASVTEFHERINGQDRLLGRVVSGNVQPPLLSDKQPTTTALQLTGAAFYAAALKLPLTEQSPRGNGDPATVVATYESLFSDPAVGNQARDHFRLFGGVTETEVAPKRAAILRFWQSNDPQLIKLGLGSLYHIRNRGLDFAKPEVAKFLGSDDPTVMKAAVSALYAFDKDLEFAKPALADLILSERLAAYKERDLDSLTDRLKSVPGGFAPAARARARVQLNDRPDLIGGRLLAVLAVLARGDEHTRQEAVNWIFAQQGEDFERAMAAVAHDYDALSSASVMTFWSKEEMDQLVARGPSVSDNGLITYVRALEHQMNGREFRPTLKKLLEDRADTANHELAKKMRNEARGIR